MEPADVVLRFLESVGSRREADFYLALFRAGEPERFAAISVDANVARHASEAVTLDLRFLAALGLYPVVVLGLFESTEALEHATRLQRRLDKAGVRAVVLGAHEPDTAARAAEAARSQTIPILAFPVAEAFPAGEARFDALGELAAALRTRKIVFLHRPGGLRQHGALLPLVNLTTDVATLVPSKELSRKERVLVEQSRRLVERAPHRLSIAITSPLNLFRELFTIKGAGTLLRRGAVIERRAFFALDKERLRALLTHSFGRPPVEEFFGRDIAWGYVEEGYRGAALVQETPLGAYLSKFAVDAEAQGEGMGRDLWQALTADYARIFWRARAHNPINPWYDKQADGLIRFPEWHVYWKGLPPVDVPAAVQFALAQPNDLP